ncbi:unnamed protein product, partial [marine sediment metagenome]
EEFAESFKEKFQSKLEGKIAVDYVYQSLSSFTEGKYIHPDRKKPWGTGHAVLCCKGKVNEPFAVINADDFYGKDAFEKAYNFLKHECNEKTYSIIGYHLPNTLSEYGSVSRGVCNVDADNNLTEINSLLTEEEQHKNFEIINDYHFGGYAKHPKELIEFMKQLWLQYNLPTDIVYTSKMMFAIFDLINKNYFPTNSKIVAVHSGGLQGNFSLPVNTLPF